MNPTHTGKFAGTTTSIRLIKHRKWLVMNTATTMVNELNRRPRLCFAVTSSTTAVSFLGGYLSALRQHGFDVTLICAPSLDVEKLAADEGVQFAPLPMRREPSPFHDMVSLIRMVRLLKRQRPDIMIYATPKASLIGALASAAVGVRSRVYELWGLRLETSQGVRFKILKALEWLTAYCSTSIVANSRSLAKRASELGVTAGKLPVVLGSGSSHGVDINRFSRHVPIPPLDPDTSKFLATSQGLVVGYIGRLHPDKGIDTILHALQLSTQMDCEVRLLIVGADEGAVFGSLLKNLSGRVPTHLVGSVKDVRPYILSMDVLALMSLREGFPNVVLEAAALEVPAVVSDSTGVIDSVVHGKTGFVVQTGNAEQLSEQLCQLGCDSELTRKLGQAARQRVLSEFSSKNVLFDHVSYFYQSVN